MGMLYSFLLIASDWGIVWPRCDQATLVSRGASFLLELCETSRPKKTCLDLKWHIFLLACMSDQAARIWR